MATTLEVVLLYLVAAVAGVVVCRTLKLPPMLGYLAVGVLIGPNALALAGDPAAARALAEFGVVFLMFVIGLEFNLPKLRSMRSLVFGLGLSQVGLTILGAVIGNVLLAAGFAALGRAWDLTLARRHRTGLGDGDVVDRHPREADGRTARARQRARPPRDGRAAVPGLGGGAVAGADPGARRGRREPRQRLGWLHWPRPACCWPCCWSAASA